MTQCTNENTCSTENNPKSNENCTIAEDILCLAKSAKHELLKEKMKKSFEAKIGKKLDKVAEVAVDAVLACLQQKMAAKQACEQYREDLMAAFKS
ncbi:MAG TPA: hypothetical protein VFT64_05900 [Rickettsiales bacterium]|nr:hypothetical protein [Rickettsiales bacterium]